MIVSVKCLENTYCMGETYRAGEVYRIDHTTANALGSSVQLMDKEMSAPPRNKMIGKAPMKK